MAKYKYSQSHFNALTKCVPTSVDLTSPGGNAIQKWANGVEEKIRLNLPDRKLSKQEIINLADTGTLSTKELFLHIMAWGEMYPINARRVFTNFKQTKLLMEKLLRGRISPEDAFSEFEKLYETGQMKGMKPAFFTKLIRFCSKNPRACIMDQWSAKSINLLLGQKLIQLNNSGSPEIGLGKAPYSKFCDVMDDLSQTFQKTPDEMDSILMSKGNWRKYLKSNYK